MVDRVYERNASGSAPQPPADPSIGYPTNGNPSGGVPATMPGAYWFHMITESLRRVVVEAGLDPDHEDLSQLLIAIKASGQFARYSTRRIYTTGEIVRGSDGQSYEFYDRDQVGTVQGVDPTHAANRPHIWMQWDGVKPGSTIEWRSVTLPEGYVENDGSEISRSDYRRVFAAFGTTYGAGDGSTTFHLPDDRGEFKRGWDHGRGIDPGRHLESQQEDSLQDHGHGIPTTTSQGGGSPDPSIRAAFRDSEYPSGAIGRAEGDVGNNVHISADIPLLTYRASIYNLFWNTRVSNETRPRNNAVIYLTRI